MCIDDVANDRSLFDMDICGDCTCGDGGDDDAVETERGGGDEPPPRPPAVTTADGADVTATNDDGTVCVLGINLYCLAACLKRTCV